MSQEIVVGDVVSLNSGGATMTVTRVITEEPVLLDCAWTDEHLVPHELRVPRACVYKRTGEVV